MKILNIKEAPYGLLLLTAIALVLVLIFSPVVNIDFQDKTMFSIPMETMLWIIPLFLFSFWLLYILTNSFLYSLTITRIHVLITMLATILIVTVVYIGLKPSQLTNDWQELIGNAIQLLSIIFVLGQLIYLCNVVLGLFGRQKTQ